MQLVVYTKRKKRRHGIYRQTRERKGVGEHVYSPLLLFPPLSLDSLRALSPLSYLQYLFFPPDLSPRKRNPFLCQSMRQKTEERNNRKGRIKREKKRKPTLSLSLFFLPSVRSIYLTPNRRHSFPSFLPGCLSISLLLSCVYYVLSASLSWNV